LAACSARRRRASESSSAWRLARGQRLRDVAGDGQHAALAVDVQHLGRDVHHAPALTAPLVRRHVMAHTAGPRQLGRKGGAHGRRPQVHRHRGAADQLFMAVARQLDEGVVDLQIATVAQAAEDQCVRAGGKGRPEAVLALTRGQQRLFALAHVAVVQHDAAHRRVIGEILTERGDAAPAAVGMAQPDQRLDARVAPLHDFGVTQGGFLQVVRVIQIEQIQTHHLLRLQAQHRARGLARIQHQALQVAHQRQHLRAVGQRAKAALAQRQGFLRQVLGGDVLHRAFEVQRLPVGAAHQMRGLAHPDGFARVVAAGLGNEIEHLAVAVQGA
jgi:hypothetical protein